MAGMELIFIIVASMGLCFGVVLETAWMLLQSKAPFPPALCSHNQGSWREHKAGQPSITGPPSQPQAAACFLPNNSVSACFMGPKWGKVKGALCISLAANRYESFYNSHLFPANGPCISSAGPAFPTAQHSQGGYVSLPIVAPEEQQTPCVSPLFNWSDAAWSPGTR